MKLLPEGRATTKKVGEELVSLNKGEWTGNELIFDPDTGKLLVMPKEAKKSIADGKVLDQLAEDGFFTTKL